MIPFLVIGVCWRCCAWVPFLCYPATRRDIGRSLEPAVLLISVRSLADHERRLSAGVRYRARGALVASEITAGVR